MISLTRQQFDTGDGKGWRPIHHTEVWYKSPFGLTRILTEAIIACNSHHADPEMVLLVPVVMAADGTYEVIT